MRGRFLISDWGGIAHAKDAKDARDGREPRPSRGGYGVKTEEAGRD
jgi:hypothetical protein